MGGRVVQKPTAERRTSGRLFAAGPLARYAKGVSGYLRCTSFCTGYRARICSDFGWAQTWFVGAPYWCFCGREVRFGLGGTVG